MPVNNKMKQFRFQYLRIDFSKKKQQRPNRGLLKNKQK